MLSVHSVVSFDFAISQVPGWHTTIFPPYFVAGAIFSGFAMVMTLIIPARQWFGLKEIITMRHLDNMAKIILATGSMVGFAYATEFFIAWYSGNPYERFTFLNRAMGPYAWAYWIMVSCNVLVPQIFWSKKARSNIALMLVIVRPGQRRDVVRALRDHRHFAFARLPAGRLGLLQADGGRPADASPAASGSSSPSSSSSFATCRWSRWRRSRA